MNLNPPPLFYRQDFYPGFSLWNESSQMWPWFCREQFTLPVFLPLWHSELEDIVFRSRDPLLGVRKQRWASEHCSHYSDNLIFSIWQTSTRLSSLSLRIYFSLKTFHELVYCFCNISSFNTKYLSMPIHSWSTKHMLGLVLIAGQTAVNEILYKVLKGSLFSYRWWLFFSHLSWLTLCNPMDRSMPGFPALHYLPEFAQTHVH